MEQENATAELVAPSAFAGAVEEVWGRRFDQFRVPSNARQEEATTVGFQGLQYSTDHLTGLVPWVSEVNFIYGEMSQRFKQRFLTQKPYSESGSTDKTLLGLGYKWYLVKKKAGRRCAFLKHLSFVSSFWKLGGVLSAKRW